MEDLKETLYEKPTLIPDPKPNSDPPSAVQTDTQQPQQQQQQPPTAVPFPPNSKKRPAENCNLSQLHNSKYFKIRSFLRDLRPHFVQVIRSPDIRNCKAANEIKEQMKMMIELYKQMIEVMVTIREGNNVPDIPPVQNPDGQKPLEHQIVTAAEQLTPGQVISRQPDEKAIPSLNISAKQEPEDFRLQGTYVVGGSAFGWNFITYPGSKAVYYGVTKELFRAKSVIPS